MAKKARKVSETAKVFMEIVAAFRYQQGPDPKDMPLTNFTFWVGAGFSKSWDLTAPTGMELFKLSPKVLEGFADGSVLSRVFGIDGRGASIDDKIGFGPSFSDFSVHGGLIQASSFRTQKLNHNKRVQNCFVHRVQKG
jgi:hypothetical protein